MKKELIEKLRDASFPLKNHIIYYESLLEKNTWLFNDKVNRKWVIPPELGDIISACGDKFECLYRIVDNDLKLKHWQAHAFGTEELAKGETIDECMVNLWLLIQNT